MTFPRAFFDRSVRFDADVLAFASARYQILRQAMLREIED